MKKLQIIAAAAVLGAMSMAVQADNSVSVQYSMIDFADVTPTAIEISYGMGVSDNVTAEAYVGFGMGDDDDVEVAMTYGLEGIYNYALNDQFSIQGLLSFNVVEVEATGGFEDDATGIGFGFGAAYAMDSGSVFVQYRNLGELDAVEEDVTSIDIGYKHNL